VGVEPHDLVNQFGQAMLDGNASLFVGAGLSMAAGLPSWGAILEPARVEAQLPAMTDYPLLAEYYVQNTHGGREKLGDLLWDETAAAGAVPTDGHRHIADLPLREIWTTNYDTLLEQVLPESFVAVREEDVQQIGGRRYVAKMHGSVDPNCRRRWAQPPVISRSDYEEYEDNRPRTWALLRATYMTRVMLFLGFSFTDPNVELLLRLARRSRTANRDRHLTVLKTPTDDQERRLHQLRVIDLERSGIQTCEIDDFRELAPLLAQLVRRTRPPQLFIAGSGPEDQMGQWGQAVGSVLASEREWRFVSLGGDAGWSVTRQVGVTQKAEGAYEPERLRFYARRKDEPAEPLNERLGTQIHTDLEREPLVQQMMQDSRALLAVQGGARTAQEIEWALAADVGVVPLAASGGSANAYWASLSTPPVLGGKPADAVDWANLNNPDMTIAARAAHRLLRQAMYTA
jgi:hypothetical protein